MATAGILAMLLLTTALYWPGLSGNYLFDDFPNIVENNAVHVTGLDWQDWKRAASASPARDLPRPLAMISYAGNYYFTGADPWPMKLTNLIIHLVNGVLLYGVLQLLLGLWNHQYGRCFQESDVTIAALGLSCAWLVCPINLSSVLYLVQRMEGLAQFFVLGGLLAYLQGRRRILAGQSGVILCTAGLVLGSGLGILCKETAALLPLYAFLLELTVLRFNAPNSAAQHHLWAIHAALLLIPGLAGLAWLLPHYLAAGAYAGRPFTLSERLLTELRIVVDYLRWTLLPHPGSLGFYHDDIVLSHSWFDPPATLGSAVLLASLLTSALALRRKIPLYALGIAWYFAAHLLTATVIPLELVFEHRNYFASIGLLLAVAALILEIQPRYRALGGALVMVVLSLFCYVTTQRAYDWGNPIRFAFAEATEHPDSPRANYELGRTLAIASGYRADSKLIEPAMQAFERATALPGSDAAAPAGLIIVAGHMHQAIKAQWWQTLSAKLASQPPAQEDISALQSLADCQRKGECPNDTPQLLDAFLAALSHPGPSARLLAAYGAFAANQLHDYALAESAFSDAASASPGNSAFKLDLVEVLILQEKLAAASELLDQLEASELNKPEATHAAELREQIRRHFPQSRTIPPGAR